MSFSRLSTLFLFMVFCRTAFGLLALLTWRKTAMTNVSPSSATPATAALEAICDPRVGWLVGWTLCTFGCASSGTIGFIQRSISNYMWISDWNFSGSLRASLSGYMETWQAALLSGFWIFQFSVEAMVWSAMNVYMVVMGLYHFLACWLARLVQAKEDTWWRVWELLGEFPKYWPSRSGELARSDPKLTLPFT